MPKIRSDHKLINVLRVIATVLIFGGIGLSAWLVWQDQDSGLQDPKTKQVIQDINGQKTTGGKQQNQLKTYTDQYVSFKYPAAWSVTKQYSFSDFYQAHVISIKAPADTSLKAADPSLKNLYLNATLTVFSDNKQVASCASCGQVFATQAIDIKGTAKGALVISATGQGSLPAIIDTTRENVASGSASYLPNGLRIGKTYNLRILASYNTQSASAVGFTKANDLTNSQQYKQLVELIQGLQVKVGNLPS